MCMFTPEELELKVPSPRESAEKRGIPCTLSLTSLKNIYRAEYCYYSGIKLTKKANKDNSITIDRIDADKGYEKGNVVACSSKWNSKKNSLTIEDIKLLYKKVCNL